MQKPRTSQSQMGMRGCHIQRRIGPSVQKQRNIPTGSCAIRSGNGTVPLGECVYGLVQWEVTMAEMLSDIGYATGNNR